MENRIILASASPRRSELLERAHIPFEVRVSDAQEDNSQGLEPSELVRHNAYIKALAVARRYPEERVVLGADTIVALDGKIYGKPSDKKRAAEMLAELSGKTHSVFTGVALAGLGGEKNSSVRKSRALASKNFPPPKSKNTSKPSTSSTRRAHTPLKSTAV